MPDIQLRFHKDMLVLSSPLDKALARQGIDAALDRQYLNLMEPDALVNALKLEVMAGAQCVVTPTEDITQARLAHVRMEGDAGRLAQSALAIAAEAKPQHVLAEIGPCGLPLDASSKASLNENRTQYAHAARAFEGGQFDAFFLNGFTSIADLKCALMGVAQASGKPVLASVALGDADEGSISPKPSLAAQGIPVAAKEDEPSGLPFGGYSFVDDPIAPPAIAAARKRLPSELWEEAIDAMADLGAAVVGFETGAPVDQAVAYAERVVNRVGLPVLAQLRVTLDEAEGVAKGLVPLEEVETYTPDTLVSAAIKLMGAGVQFLRATGAATPACTGALAATVSGLDVCSR